MSLLQGRTGLWEVIVGLEVHAQATTKSKLFSSASTDFGAEPNTQVSLVDAAFPGMLPVLNTFAVEQAVKTGLGLKAKINLHSIFDRKNYFYPDLPQGYQISQNSDPIVGHGFVMIDLPDGTTRKIGIERIHLEQDAGKSIHDLDPERTFVDLNRAGTPLMEIVTKPDLRNADEAGQFVRKLRSILRYLETCDGNMEQGSMRCDVNVSVRKVGDPLGTRCEVKNVNSIKFMQQAIDHEAARQIELLENGEEIRQETRQFDPGTGTTRSLRDKEDAQDYRYFPDPDLVPLVLTQDYIDHIAKNLPELPDEKKERFVTSFGLSSYDAGVLVATRQTADFFEEVAQKSDPKLAANWITGELFAALNTLGKTIEDSPISAEALSGLIRLIGDGTISGRIAKDVFADMLESAKDAPTIVQEKGLVQNSDPAEIETMIKGILEANPQMVADYRSGKDRLFGFFVGQVMKQSGGKANPTLVNDLLINLLKE